MHSLLRGTRRAVPSDFRISRHRDRLPRAGIVSPLFYRSDPPLFLSLSLSSIERGAIFLPEIGDIFVHSFFPKVHQRISQVVHKLERTTRWIFSSCVHASCVYIHF